MSDDKEGGALAGCVVFIVAVMVIRVVVENVEAISAAIVVALKFLALGTIILGTAWFAGWTLWLLISWIIEHRKEAKKKLARRYAAWLQGSPVDGEHTQAAQSIKGLETQREELRSFLVVLQGRHTSKMLPTHLNQHTETLTAVHKCMSLLEPHIQVWHERLVVLTAQQTFQRALRSVPPWLGGASLGERPTVYRCLWPKKPSDMTKSVVEAQNALQKITAAQTSMQKVEQDMAKELPGASQEAKVHLHTLLERIEGLRTRLGTRLVECQTHEDRQRAFALIAKTQADTFSRHAAPRSPADAHLDVFSFCQFCGG